MKAEKERIIEIEQSITNKWEISKCLKNKQLGFQKESRQKRKKIDEIIPLDFPKYEKVINHRSNKLS